MTKHRFSYPLNKTCVNCGKGFIVKNGAENRNVTCSKKCGDTVASNSRSGKNHWAWNGGKRVSRGYIEILKPDHPYASKQGYVLKHRLVIEKSLNRYLLPSEVVHHLNRNKQDNRLKNLKLLASGSEHAKEHGKDFGERMRKSNTGKTPWNKGKKLGHPVNYSGVMIECLNCGKRKHYPPSTIKKGKGKYCSKGCAFEYRYRIKKIPDK